eukprot:scaffold86_cov338-Pavlova_lutheri.AAC.78
MVFGTDVFVNRHLETQSKDRMFDLAPPYRVRNQFATFDTNVRHRVFRESGWVNADHPSFVEMSDDRWTPVWNVDGKQPDLMCRSNKDTVQNGSDVGYPNEKKDGMGSGMEA